MPFWFKIAAMLVLVSGDFAKSKGLKALARVVQWGVAGVEPMLMGIGPAYAIPKALERAGLKQSDIDLFDVNEAFSAQWLAVQRHLELPLERSGRSWRWTTRPSSGRGRRPTGPESRREPTD